MASKKKHRRSSGRKPARRSYRRGKRSSTAGYGLVEVPLGDHYGLVEVPLGDYGLPKLFGQQVGSTDVLVGAGAGVVGASALSALLNKYAGDMMAKLPEFIQPALPLLASLGVGLGLYFAQKNSNPGRATGHLIGAGAAGVAATVSAAMVKYHPFSGLVDVRYQGWGGYGDIYANESAGGGYGDIYANESAGFPMQQGMGDFAYADNPALAEVMAHAMGDSDGDQSDIEALMYM